MNPVRLSVFLLLGLSLGACGLGTKDLSGATADSGSEASASETGAGGPTATSAPGPSTGPSGDTDTSAADTGNATGEPQQCDDPLQFPGFSKTCASDADCAVVFHQTDCCGSLEALGIDADNVDAYGETEAMCAAMYPACECAPMPTTTEDGESTHDSSEIGATCIDNMCKSGIPDAGPLKWYSTCGDPVCQGYTKQDGIELCGPGQMEGNLCDVEGATCDPMSDCNALLVCATKDPKQNEGGCPISRARFKTEIEYLTPADLERHAADLQSLRLATYRYRDAPAGAPPRLGIILEDNERGVWVDAAHDRVDLYGYASLAVAALQVQQQQIAALQAEVERLSARLENSAMCEP